MSQPDTSTRRFHISQVEGRIRFQSEEGWFELKPENGRALCMAGTFNATVPEVFGGRVWHLLQTVMQDFQLKVCQTLLDPDNLWLLRIFLAAGFQKDGQLRAWGPNFQDMAVYSILDTEVRYEVRDAGSATNEPPDGPVDTGDAESASGDGQDSVSGVRSDDGVSGAGQNGAGTATEPDGASVPAVGAADATAAG